MNCPSCETELKHDDYIMKKCRIVGVIYRCPNGHENAEVPEEDVENPCESSLFYVAGSYHVYDKNPDEILQGYPC